MKTPCTIVLADDHTLFRNGLRTLLGGIEGFVVTAEASDGIELLELLEHERPDVVLLDIEMPRMNGIVAAEEALRRYPDLKIITLSMYGDEDYYFRMVSLGVKGFILKNSDIRDVVAAIETVVDGGSFFSQELLFNLVKIVYRGGNLVDTSTKAAIHPRQDRLQEHGQPRRLRHQEPLGRNLIPFSPAGR